MVEKKAKGWHLKNSTAPHRGKGTATVEPLRKKNDIDVIKQYLRNNPRDHALFTIGINTGLRANDLVSLKYKDVLTPEGNVKSALNVLEHKTNKSRRIVIGGKAREALSNLYSTTKDINPDDYIFPSRKGGKMSIQRLHQLVNEWAKKAGVNGHFGSHTLRKTYGHFHYKKGTDISILMDAFGHSSQAITLRYIGLQQQKIDEANLRLNL